jgi:hypothetical protein
MISKDIAKINIIEPWEYGTEKPISINNIDKLGSKYLFHLSEPYQINKKYYNFLIGRPKDFKINLFNIKKNQVIVLEIHFGENVSELNFYNLNFDDFRGNFLLGDFFLTKDDL